MGTRLTVIGNLTRDFEAKVFDSGNVVANGAIAINERVKDRTTGEYKDGEPTFFDLVVIGEKHVENVCNSLPKGTRVIVAGNLRTRRWADKDDPEKKHERPEIVVDEIGPSLRWAEAEVTRNPKGSGGNGHRAPEPEESDYFDG